MEKLYDSFTEERILKHDVATDYWGRIFNKKYKCIFLNKIISIKDPDIVVDCCLAGSYMHKNIALGNSVYYLKNSKILMGHTTKNPASLVQIVEPDGVKFADCKETAIHMGYEEDCTYGVFKTKGLNLNNKIHVPKYIKRPYTKFSNSLKDRIKYGVFSPTNIIAEHKDYTFGVEIETCGGIMPEYISEHLNMDCQYDGSIRDNNGNKDCGGEYTTGVLVGDAGFKQLFELCNELSKRCKINTSCSIHVHLGNMSFNKENVVLMYKLFQMIEAEMYSVVPQRRSKVGYCNPMRPISINLARRGVPYDILIDKYYDEIVKIVSLGKAPGKGINKNVNHPLGRYCNYDRSTPRYWWCNFVPTLFNLKGKGNNTIEFRNHPATLDYIKIRNWILLCMGIMSFVENHKQYIIDSKVISLARILKAEYAGKGQYLTNYFDERRELFLNDTLEEEKEFKRIPHKSYEKINGMLKLVKL